MSLLSDTASSLSFSGTRRSTAATSVNGSSKGFNLKSTRWTGLTSFQTAMKAMSAMLEKERRGNNYVCYTNIDADTFDMLETMRDAKSLGYNAKFDYEPSSKELMIKLPSLPYENAHVVLFGMIHKETILMGCDKELNPCGAGKRKNSNTGISKEPDFSWTTIDRTRNKVKFPTLVIESGYSESLPQLRADAARWIEISGGLVRIVLLLSIRSDTSEIVLKKWAPVENVVTRSGTTITPEKLQMITVQMKKQRPREAPGGTYVHLKGLGPKGHFYVEGGSLRIYFKELFGRNPDPRKPQEKDIVLDEDLLAELCWRTFAEDDRLEE